MTQMAQMFFAIHRGGKCALFCNFFNISVTKNYNNSLVLIETQTQYRKNILADLFFNATKKEKI